ncbi:MAG: ArgE/DapE family deacylase [Candidatus Poribacteria bacterium]|nr:ArgE/DapE family deacylase [Candidatus Poribacteria bacterium]
MERLDAFIDAHRDETIELLKRLVAVPTVNPPGERYPEMVDLLEAECRALGLATARHEVCTEEAVAYVPTAEGHPRVNLIARWDVGAEKTVHFNSHYDVVPVSDGWDADPFEPRVQEGYLYGRGSDDMKDSIAATLAAIRALKDSKVNPTFNLELSFTADEEIGGDLGAGFIARHGLIDADYVVNCEGGTENDVGSGHNGVLWLEITVHGKAAHASRPNNGINAFEKMTELVTGLQSLKVRLSAPHRVFVTPSGAERFPTINIGGVFYGTDGDKTNTVPAKATFSIDRRILPNESVASAEEELRGAIESAGASILDLKMEIRRTLAIEPCVVDTTDPFCLAFLKTVKDVRGTEPAFSVTTGFTDLHFLVEDGKRPGVGYGPKGNGAHGANERVDLNDLIVTTKIFARFMATPI